MNDSPDAMNEYAKPRLLGPIPVDDVPVSDVVSDETSFLNLPEEDIQAISEALHNQQRNYGPITPVEA